MISMKELAALSPDNCFVAISRTVGQRLNGAGTGGTYDDMRRVILASIRQTAQINVQTIRRFDPPRPQRSGHDGLIQAEFELMTWIVNSSMQCRVDYDCRLVDGSPMGNMPYTLILMSARIVDASLPVESFAQQRRSGSFAVEG